MQCFLYFFIFFSLQFLITSSKFIPQPLIRHLHQLQILIAGWIPWNLFFLSLYLLLPDHPSSLSHLLSSSPLSSLHSLHLDLLRDNTTPSSHISHYCFVCLNIHFGASKYLLRIFINTRYDMQRFRTIINDPLIWIWSWTNQQTMLFISLSWNHAVVARARPSTQAPIDTSGNLSRGVPQFCFYPTSYFFVT